MPGDFYKKRKKDWSLDWKHVNVISVNINISFDKYIFYYKWRAYTYMLYVELFVCL